MFPQWEWERVLDNDNVNVAVNCSSFTKIKDELKSHNQIYTYDCIIAEVQTANYSSFVKKRRENDRN